MFYIIVKEAADGHWEKRFKLDPKKTPNGQGLSAYRSNLGKLGHCKLWYSEQNLTQANEDCKKLNKLYPSGGYAVCPMKE